MDMAANQAPPPIVSEAQREEDIVRQLMTVHDDLSSMQLAQPLPPASPTPGTREPFLSAWDAWWKAPGSTDGTSAQARLAGHLATVMGADAQLRAREGSITQGDSEALVAFARSGGAMLPRGFEARELRVGDAAYAGAVVLAASGGAGAWAFMPERGWEHFSSLPALHDAIDDRLRHDLIARDTPGGLRVSDVDGVVAEGGPWVSSRNVIGAVIPGMARRIVEAQREQVVDAWDNLDRGDTADSVADAVRAALDIHARIDIGAMLADRERRTLAARRARRLAAVPAEARADWLQAASQWRDALTAIRQLDPANAAGDDDIEAALPADADAVRRRRDALVASLAPQGAAAARWSASRDLGRARLAMAAADARLGYYLPSDPQAFLADRDERGYRWLMAIVDAPAAANRPRIGGHTIVARQVTYRGAVLGGVFVIGTSQPASVPRLVVYTPDAPDGRAIREFEDAAEAAREFFLNPRFESWLLDRLPATHADLDANGNRHFAIPDGTKVAHWALGQPGGGEFTRTAEPFGEKVVDGDIFDAMLSADIARMAIDMTDLEAALVDASPSIGWQAARFVADAAAPMAQLARETLAGLGRGLRALWRVEEAVKAGDYHGAFIDATEAYVNLLVLAPGVHIAARPTGYLGGLLASRLPGLNAGAMHAARYRAFDTRYAARAVDLAGSRPDLRGIHTLAGRRYIVSSGTAFEVRFDAANRTWRIARPGCADALFCGPPIHRSPDGWRVLADIGLRGGGRRSTVPPQRTAQGAWRTATEADYHRLTAPQREEFLRVLRQRLGGAVADDLHVQVLLAEGRAIPLSRARFDAWSDAMHAARLSPAVPRPQTPPPVLDPGVSWREVPASEWPDAVWYYPRRAVETIDQPTLYLPAVRVRGSGLSGLVVSPVDPALRAARGGTHPHGWVRVNLRRLRGHGTSDGQPAVRVFVNDQRDTPHYVLRTAGEEQGSFLVLRQGQFDAGPPA